MAVESGGLFIFFTIDKHIFYLQMTMSCISWWNHCNAHTHHSNLYLITVLTAQKTSRSFPLSSKLTVLSKNLDKLLLLQPTHLALNNSLFALHLLHFALHIELPGLIHEAWHVALNPIW